MIAEFRRPSHRSASSTDSESTQMNTTPSAQRRTGRARYIAAAVVVAAIAVAGFFAFNGKSTVPDATFTLLSGQRCRPAAT
jgi:hypothetical protein